VPKLLENTAFVLTFTVIAGLFLPMFAEAVIPFTTVLLVIAMSISLREVAFSREDVSSNASSSFKAFILNYGLHSFTVIALAYLLVPQPSYFAGFVALAAIPPAVYIVPLTYLLKGDVKTALGGELISYILALAMAPLITLAFLGQGVGILEIAGLLLLLIITPLLVSHALKRLPDSFFSRSKPAVNLSLALVIYAVIGINQKALFSDFTVLLPLLFIVFFRSFGLGSIVYCVSRRLCASRESAITYTLFASYKSVGMAAVFALVLSGTAAGLPAGLAAIFEVSFLLFLQWVVRKKVCAFCSIC
jgi:BASS family bile acid:Na+ symporter